jgi:hypothetical protein
MAKMSKTGMMSFSNSDAAAIVARGSDIDTVTQQMKNFETGFPLLPVDRPARVGDGIIRLSDEQAQQLDESFEDVRGDKQVLKFVPASGAASRMFKALFAFVQNEEAALEGPVEAAWKALSDFAFYDELMAKVPQELHDNPRAVFKTLLEPQGLDYGRLPKGLLAFHSYGEDARTPVEEHLVEAANYSQDAGGTARLHFTVSPEHRHGFIRLIDQQYDRYKQAYNCEFDIGFSEQKPATDTIAVDMENQPFRLENGDILFRPGGHGALIENLNDLDADIIFVKNIDNVCPDRMKADTFRYKRALASLLLQIREEVFNYAAKLENGEAGNQEVEDFIQNKLQVTLPEAYSNYTPDEQSAWLMARLHRPIRVCGMVKNEGEPGGGPFWTHMPDGSISLQIVESAQLDPNDESVTAKVQQATHFNPVDLVCAVKDRDGDKFDLRNFVDPRTGFITGKSLQGRELKAQELPGLWNGAMAHWNTLFVEVPISTFNPVKTVNDLLREQHQ